MHNQIIPHSRPTLGKEEESATAEVIRSGQIAQGEKVAHFEHIFSTYIGRKYGVAVNSGLSALHLALLALKIKEGDHVIMPTYTCDAILHAVLYTGAKPVIVDVAYEDGNVTARSVKDAITSMTKAIIVPHTFGFPAKIDEIVACGVPVIEDCALSVGALYKKRKTGTFGRIAVFSFYATKMLTTGEGGMVVTDERDIADHVRELRDYTGHKEFLVRYNYKMTDLGAAIGIVQLRRLRAFIKKRRQLARVYDSFLSGREDILLPSHNEQTEPVFYRYVVKILNRDVGRIKDKMYEKGIQCGNGVLQPLHRFLGLPAHDYPNAERLTVQNISLPIYPLLGKGDIRRVANALVSVMGE